MRPGRRRAAVAHGRRRGAPANAQPFGRPPSSPAMREQDWLAVVLGGIAAVMFVAGIALAVT